MTQEIIAWALLAGLVGLIWVMVIAVLDAHHHSQNNQQRSAQPERHNGYEPNEYTSQESRVAA